MGFKTFVKNTFDYGKQGLSKGIRWSSRVGESIADKWTNKVQPWIENTIGSTATKGIAEEAGKAVGRWAGTTAGSIVSTVPIVGALAAPLVKTWVSNYYSKKTSNLISPVNRQMAPTPDDPPIQIKPTQSNKKAPNDTPSSLPPPSLSPPPSIPQPPDPFKFGTNKQPKIPQPLVSTPPPSPPSFLPSASTRTVQLIRSKLRARKNGRVTRNLLAIDWDGAHPFGTPSVFGSNMG